jgi:hypothetical protein
MMTAVCLLLGVEPKMVKREGNSNKKEADWWTPAAGPKVLGNGQFLSILAKLDPEGFRNEVMLKVEECLSDPDYTLANV